MIRIKGIPFDDQDPVYNPLVPMARGERNQIIPQAEDMRRLFEECNVGRANAQLLIQALSFTKPSDLRDNSVIEVCMLINHGQHPFALTLHRGIPPEVSRFT